MNDEYEAVMTAEDGSVLKVTGTIMQCANWSENMIRQHGGGQIDIRRLEVEEDA